MKTKLEMNNLQKIVYGVMGTKAAPLLSQLKSIAPDPSFPTMGINKEGGICYNPDFVEKHCRDEVSLVTLLVHEFCHPLMRHHGRTEGKNPTIANVAQDAIINATISKMPWSQNGVFFNETYGLKEDPHPLESLLYPLGKVPDSLPSMKMAKEDCFERQSISSEEVYEAILKDMPPDEKNGSGEGEGKESSSEKENGSPTEGDNSSSEDSPMVLGDHSESSEEELSPENLLERAEVLEKMLGEEAGKGGLMSEVIAKIKSDFRHLRKDSLYKWAVKRKFGKFVKRIHRQRIRTAPYILNPSRMDIVKMGLAIPQSFYNNSILEAAKTQKHEVVMYLDVSGSIGIKELGEAVSIISQFKFAPSEIFQFSTEIKSVSLEELKEGIIKTTGGTDFQCVLDHIQKNNHERAIVFSDGYGSLSLVKTPPRHLKVFEVGYGSSRANLFPFVSAGYDATYADIEDLLR